MSLGAYNAQSKSLVSPFESSSSFSFDGSDDVITTSVDSTLATKTYSFWAKSSSGSQNPVFEHGAQTKGAFYLNAFGNDKPLLWLNGGWYRYFEDTTKAQDGLWHHWLLLLHTDVTQSRLFCDGVELAADSTVTTSSGAAAYTTGIKIGRIDAYGTFNGSLDEFAIFDGDQSALADELYNNGQPTNLSSYSTLDHWFRMGEGKLGTKSDGDSNILFQGIEYTGSELLTNGDFSTDTDWTDYLASSSGGSVVITGGQLKITQGSNSVWMGASQSFSITQGKTYSVRGTYSGGNSHGRIKVGNSAGNDTYLDASSLTPGNKLVQFTATATGTAHITLLDGQGATNIGYWDNVSVKEARGQQVGGELITNGTFASNVTSWPASSSGTVTWSNGTAITGAVGTDDRGGMSQTFTTVNGATYQLTFDVISRTSTKWEVYRQGTGPGTIIEGTDLGSHSTFFTAAATSTELAFYAKQAGTSDGTVAWDNISVREVQNVGTISGATALPAEGAELLTGFTNGSSYPFNTFTSSGRDITAAIETSGDFAGGASNQFSIVDETTYKVTFDLTYNSGSDTLRVVLADNANGAATLRSNAYYTNTNGVNVAYLTATATDSTAHLQIGTWHESDLINFSATNITLQEVTNGVPLQTQNLAPISRGEKSLSFDGSDDVVEVSSLSTLSGASQFTLSGWFNKADAGHPLTISYTQNSSNRTSINFANDSKVYLNVAAGGANYGEFALASTDWVHLAMVYDGNSSGNAARLKGYLDGVEQTLTFNSTIPATAHSQSAIFRIGKDQANGVFSQGGISDVAVWDAALSASAIKALYNAGQSSHLTVNTGAYTYRQNLQAYYKMGSATVPDADGTNGFLFDQKDPGLKAELFPSNPSASDWAQLSSFDWDGSILSVTDSSGTPIASYSLSLPVGSTYLLSFDITNDGTGNFYARIGDGTNSFAQGSVTSGSYEVIHTVTSSGHNGNIMLISNSGFSGSVTNISVREVKGNTGTISGASVVDNNVPRQVYALPPLDNTKSINFDGTNDHLVTQVDATAQPNNESRYYSFWAKSTLTSSNRVFDHGDFTIGGFAFNHSSNRPLLYMSATVFRYWDDNSAQDSGEWAHWMCKIKTNDITGCELWCNGVKQTVNQDNNSGSMNVYTAGIRIGRAGTGHFNGSIDSFCIWGELSNPEEVARALYNAGRPIDPSKSLGAANQPQLLRHWWRMGDASHDGNADGTNDILFEGVQYLGDELIENGTYNSDTSGWTASDGATLTVVDGKLRITTSAAYKYAYQSFPTEVGAKYLFSVTGTKGTSPNYDAYFGNAKNSSTLLYPGTKGAADSQGDSVIITDTFTATATTTFITLRSRNEGSIANAFTDFDDVTVKQVRGQYRGVELMKADDDLYIDARWYVFSDPAKTYPSGTAARFTNPATGGWNQGGRIFLTTGSGTHALTADMESGCVYKLSFDFLTDDSDAVPSYHDGTSATSLPAGSGSKTFYFSFSGSASTRLEAANVSASKFVEFSKLSLTKLNGGAAMVNMDPGSDIVTDTPY